MVCGNCPKCGALYCRLSPCQCDLGAVAQMTQKSLLKNYKKLKLLNW